MLQLGEMVRKHRREANLTQAKLAEMIGVTAGYIAKIEINHQLPSGKTIIKIADALRIEGKELFATVPVYLSDMARMSDEIGEYDKKFKKLNPRVKELLLEMAKVVKNTCKKSPLRGLLGLTKPPVIISWIAFLC